jgi:hypothetical protein
MEGMSKDRQSKGQVCNDGVLRVKIRRKLLA